MCAAKNGFVALVVAAGAALALAPPAAAAAVFGAGRFVAADPVRVYDSRVGAPVGSGATVRMDLSRWLPTGTSAVVLNITGTGATTATFLTASPVGIPRAGATLDLRSGETRVSQVTVGVHTLRAVDVHNSAGTAHVIADLAGYYQIGGAGAGFHAIAPQRIVDTRPGAPLGPAGKRTVDFGDALPVDAVAVTFVLTGTESTAATHVTAWPTGDTRPASSNLSLLRADTRANLVTVALGAGRSADIYNSAGRTDVIVELVGYYTADSGSAYRALAPAREYDTRWAYPSGLPGLPIPARSRGSFSVVGSVPSTATGVVLNVTGVGPTHGTHLTVWAPAASSRPDIYTVHVAAGRTVSNTVALGLRETDVVGVYNNAGRTHVAVDLLGYFLDEGAPAA